MAKKRYDLATWYQQGRGLRQGQDISREIAPRIFGMETRGALFYIRAMCRQRRYFFRAAAAVSFTWGLWHSAQLVVVS